MLDAQESAELRALQAKAYGRDGVLTRSDRARLIELEARRATRSAAEPVTEPVEVPALPVAEPVEASAPASAVPVVARSPQGVDGTTPPAADASADSPRGPQWFRRSSIRARRWILAGAAVVALGLGVGVGWVLFGWNSAAFMLALAHGEKHAELEASGDFDPGSVVAVSEQHEAVVWRAQRASGTQECLILTSRGETAFECVLNERIEEPGALYVNLQVPGEGTTFDSLTATLLREPDGGYIPVVQSWSSQEYDWRDQFTAEELEVVERIEAAGYDGGALEIVGYDGASPVWWSWGTNGPCVIAVGDSGVVEACAVDHASDVTLITVVGGVRTEYLVRQTDTRGPQLTVVKPPTAMGIDDKTGEITEYTFDDLVREEDE